MQNLPRAMFIDLDDTLLASTEAARYATEVIVKQLANDSQLPLKRVREEMEEANVWFWSDEERRTQARLNQAGARTMIIKRSLEGLKVSAGIDADALGLRLVAERLR